MNYVKSKVKIPEDDYNKLIKRSKEEIEDYVMNVAYNSLFQPCAYGFYLPMIFKENGICYASRGHYDSCD